eukprot:TRINITY_DN3123_c0_g1_i1.p1 TRINITY_DN3123_c0_g1~~TRINITY_DN3123_c0_g1_i1.p1  ORF type:complete len:473 (+),score=187.18 TRINITY_DN3123_c0_g1_i1:147-1565(+)
MSFLFLQPRAIASCKFLQKPPRLNSFQKIQTTNLRLNRTSRAAFSTEQETPAESFESRDWLHMLKEIKKDSSKYNFYRKDIALNWQMQEELVNDHYRRLELRKRLGLEQETQEEEEEDVSLEEETTNDKEGEGQELQQDEKEERWDMSVKRTEAQSEREKAKIKNQLIFENLYSQDKAETQAKGGSFFASESDLASLEKLQEEDPEEIFRQLKIPSNELDKEDLRLFIKKLAEEQEGEEKPEMQEELEDDEDEEEEGEGKGKSKVSALHRPDQDFENLEDEAMAEQRSGSTPKFGFIPSKEYIKHREVLKMGRHTKITAGGRMFSFSCLVLIGNGNGSAGLGYGKALTVAQAVVNANRDAEKNIISFPLHEGRTIPADWSGKVGCSKFILRRGGDGFGLQLLHKWYPIIQLFGYKDLFFRTYWARRNKANLIRAMMKGFRAYLPPDSVALATGKKHFSMNKVVRKGDIKYSF